VIGYVDDSGRALLEISMAGSADGPWSPLVAWIDTAFDGHLVLSPQLVEELNLDTLAQTEAILADGSKVLLEAYLSYVDWFGEVIPVQVIASDGRYPLLGIGLLTRQVLHINYVTKELRVE
jgi:clan AA aspartic protease